MKKTHPQHFEQCSSFSNHSDAKKLQHVIEHTSNAKRRRNKRHNSALIYEEGDLRGIVIKALAKSIDPYHALLEFGVIKNAAEFFDGGNR